MDVGEVLRIDVGGVVGIDVNGERAGAVLNTVVTSSKVSLVAPRSFFLFSFLKSVLAAL